MNIIKFYFRQFIEIIFASKESKTLTKIQMFQ